VSLLVVEYKRLVTGCERGSTESPYSSLRIVNVLAYEISLEAGFHGSSSYAIRPVPRRVAACRIHALYELTGADTVDTDTGHRTTTSDTGRTTSDTGRADAGHVRTPDPRRADARHADAGWRSSTGDQGTVAPGHPGTTTPLGRRTMLLCTAHAALGNHGGDEATCQRVRLLAALPGSCWVAPPAAKRRLGALLSSNDFGSSVDRAAKLHPLWRLRRSWGC
jgi:hypothetical protein